MGQFGAAPERPSGPRRLSPKSRRRCRPLRQPQPSARRRRSDASWRASYLNLDAVGSGRRRWVFRHGTVITGMPTPCSSLTTSALAAYISGERGTSPSVQTLVRGHFQRVAVGAGSVGRRWVHKAPYWRGPEDARVAVHTHRLAARR